MSAPIILPKRDLAVIVMVYLFGGCSSDHVAARLFPGLKSPRVCYRRLAELVKQGYLVSRRLPSSSGVGSGKNFLALGPRGRAVVAQALGLPATELSRSRIDAPRFIEHHLAVCSSRVVFELAAERSKLFTMVEWSRDGTVEIKVKEKEGREFCLTPDGAFTLALPDGRTQRFFLEQDMGSMTNSKRMRVRLAGYLASSRLIPIPVLFVTTTQQRLAAIASLAVEEAQRLKVEANTIWLTTNHRLTEEAVLDAPIWQVVGLASPVSVAGLVSPEVVDGRPASPAQRFSSRVAEAIGMPEAAPAISMAIPRGYS